MNKSKYQKLTCTQARLQWGGNCGTTCHGLVPLGLLLSGETSVNSLALFGISNVCK